MSKLSAWAERMIREVGEEGTLTSKITVTTVENGQLWDTWDAPIDLTKFLEQADQFKAQLATELPKKRHQILWTAVDANANMRGQCPDHIVGSNAQAQDLGNGQRAGAETMDALARTMDKVLRSSEAQCASLTKTVEVQGEHINAMHELRIAELEATILKKTEEASVDKAIAEQIKGAAPMIMELLVTLVANAKPNSTLGQVAAAASSLMSNGHNGIAQG